MSHDLAICKEGLEHGRPRAASGAVFPTHGASTVAHTHRNQKKNIFTRVWDRPDWLILCLLLLAFQK